MSLVFVRTGPSNMHRCRAFPFALAGLFLFAKITQISYFFAFPIFRKVDKFAGLYWTSKNQKCFSFRGLCLWTQLPSNPRYRLALLRSPLDRAPLQILRARTATDDVTLIGCLHDRASIEQTSSKCIQITRANCSTPARHLLDVCCYML